MGDDERRDEPVAMAGGAAGAEDVAEADFEAPDRGSADELLDAGAADELGPMRHSAAHVMAEAVLDLFPGARLGIGPAIADGFYYDFELPRPLTPDDLAAIEARMAASVAADHPFERRELPFTEARARNSPVAQAHRLHVVGDAGEPRPVPGAQGGGEEARPPPARGPARPVQLP